MLNKKSLAGQLADEIAQSKAEKPKDAASIPERSELSGIGGWLLFFCVSLTIISPGGMIYQVVDSLIANKQALAGNVVNRVTNIVMAVYGLVVGILLWTQRKGSVTQAKIFLTVNLAAVCGLSVFFSNSRRVANTFKRDTPAN